MSRNALKGKTRIHTLSMILLPPHIKERGYSAACFKAAALFAFLTRICCVFYIANLKRLYLFRYNAELGI